MWRDAPSVYGPSKTLYNRFVRWNKKGVFDAIFAALATRSDATDTVMIDATHLKGALFSAIGVDDEGWRSVLSVSVALCEAEVHWRSFLDDLVRRGMRGVEFVTSDHHHPGRVA